MRNKLTIVFALFFMFSSILLIGQSRNVDNFHAVSISSGITAKLVKSNSPKVEYTIKKGSDEDLITKVKNGVLYVKTKSKMGWGNSVQVDVTVHYTNLDDIEVSSGCTVKSEGTITSNSLDIEVGSGSTAHFEIEADEVDADVSSGSTLKLKGKASKGDFEAASGSTLNADHLIIDDADVEASSGSSVFIHVNNRLDASAASGSAIYYTGDVKIKNIDAGWSGSVTRKG
ncbi:MAG: head GIN domain-containing protein [Bacteroidota bacterium]